MIMCKKILYTFLLVALFTACTEDKGNYDYLDAKDVINASFSGILESHEITLGSSLKIQPEITGLSANKKYEYLWYIVTRTAISGKAPIRKDLSENRDLDVIINGVDATDYTLYFQITDVQTGVFINTSTLLKIEPSDISAGWYILKEMDGMTDIDYVKLADSTLYSNLLRDYSISGDVRLAGSPVAIAYQPSGYYHNIINEETGVVKTTPLSRIVHVASTKDVRTFQRGNFTLYKDFGDQFYKTPEACTPQNLIFYSGMYFLNDGELYTFSSMMLGIGKYTAPRINGGNLSSQMLLWNGYVMCYDKETRSLCYGSNSYALTSILPFVDKVVDGKTISSSNMDYELVAVPTSTYNASSSSNRTLLMRSVTNNNYYTVDITLDGKNFSCPLGTFKPVPAGSKVLQSSVFASQHSIIEFYFGVENSLYYYDHNSIAENGREVKILDYDAGEVITSISHIRVSSTYKKLIVLTYKEATDTWKMYIHNIPADNTVAIGTTPEAVFSGKGKAKGMFYTGS